MELHVLTTDTAATLWWDKPDIAPAKYDVLLDNRKICTVDRTHVTLDDLTPDTEYAVSIEGIGQMPVRTRRAIRHIDVTAAPYFAKGDGMTVNTAALQQAINDCGADECVFLPHGIFMTGALRLHSHMALCIAEGAVLQGTQTITDYEPRIPSRFEGIEGMCYSSLLNLGDLDHTSGPNCEDVLLYGGGTICGGGQTLARKIIEDERIRLKAYLEELGDKVLECENLDTIPGRVRGRLINMSNCRDIRITGLTLADGPCWNVHMVYSDHITTDHCTIRGRHVWNGDGWDPDSSTNCTLFACLLQTTDDCVAIKSGKNPEGNVINRPTTHIRIFDCLAESGNGIAMGSEISGGIENVAVWDCDLTNTNYGLEIKGTKKRGGYVRNVFIRDSILPRMMAHAVTYNDDGIGAPMPPLFSCYVFENVQITGRKLNHEGKWEAVPAIELQGFDVPGHEVADVSFRNCTIAGDAEVKMHRCRNIFVQLNNVD